MTRLEIAARCPERVLADSTYGDPALARGCVHAALDWADSLIAEDARRGQPWSHDMDKAVGGLMDQNEIAGLRRDLRNSNSIADSLRTQVDALQGELRKERRDNTAAVVALSVQTDDLRALLSESGRQLEEAQKRVVDQKRCIEHHDGRVRDLEAANNTLRIQRDEMLGKARMV